VDLNHRHRAYETPALPLSYTARSSTIPGDDFRVHRDRVDETGDKVILNRMPMEQQEKFKECPLCGLDVPETDVQECFICHATFCQYCAILDYGRTFCSDRCRGFFFWGDGDANEGDY
jgi:hypothetical protein